MGQNVKLSTVTTSCCIFHLIFTIQFGGRKFINFEIEIYNEYLIFLQLPYIMLQIIFLYTDLISISMLTSTKIKIAKYVFRLIIVFDIEILEKKM